ncbi:MAG TPA: type II secretion system F family protein [Isosphaeraceae bacterium]|jgi:type II secretory pathway component PulF|nr:type II secretion system F family protein [Isosphaeraceae bacterium]
MSRDAGEPLPPRRPRPDDRPAQPAPEIDPYADIEDADTEPPSTFRAKPGPQATAPKRKKRDPDRPLPVSGGPTRLERLLFGTVSTGHLTIFCRQFGQYLNAGVDLIRSLNSLQEQFARTALGPALQRVALAVRRGDELSEAMAREPQAFDPFFLSMFRVAEARGGIPETLRGLADHYEARQRLVRQARSAMIYPVAVLSVALGVCAVLAYFVLPFLVSILEDMVQGKGGTDSLPGPTRLLVDVTHFMTRLGWWLVPALLVGGTFVLLRAYRTPAGKAAIDEVGLHVPVLGKLLQKIDTTRFARTLSALMEAGVDLNRSLKLTGDVLRLAPFRRAIEGARAAAAEGVELSESLRASRRFGPDVIAIVESGEETGKLPESLHHLADDYEEQVTYMVKNLGQLVQPIITLGLGGLVGFIAVAFIMAYLSVLSSLGGR